LNRISEPKGLETNVKIVLSFKLTYFNEPVQNIIFVLELLGRSEGKLLQEMGHAAGICHLKPMKIILKVILVFL
jgi:hypothetical protein